MDRIDTSNDSRHQRLVSRITRFLDVHRWLLDMRIVDFFTECHWDKLPHCWQQSFSHYELEDVCQLLLACQQGSVVWPLSLMSFAVCCHALSLQRQPATPPEPAANRSKHVKPKKQHEVNLLSEVIHQLTEQLNCQHVIDIGSGHGHLARHLAFHHQLNVITVEADSSHFKPASKFDREVEEELEKKARRGVSVNNCGKLQHIIHHIKPDSGYKEVTELLQHCVGVADKSVGVADSKQIAVLAGLHTCGDLSATMLRMFCSSPQIVGLVNVGCCYMKLTSASSTEPHPSSPIGYPVSKAVMSLDGHWLSYEARELACHALELYRDRVLNGSEYLKIHCHRAVVQTILKKHFLERAPVMIPKKTSKLPFKEYAHAILSLFNLPAELDMKTLDPLLARWKDVVVLFMLRLAIAPCVESVILLDRLLYLREQGDQVSCDCGIEFFQTRCDCGKQFSNMH
ncbi:methyltransferase-like protein 25B isoform X2 [Dysidea avara]|uniref:methyltransferase-like protein 25B isoform X2 n=1 Tax=Dysidea avara TaxID=196820 RepID=UPI00332B1DF4